MNMKAAIFDMDGTLLDSLGFWPSFWKKFGIRYFGDPSYEVPKEIDNAVRTSTLELCAGFVRDGLLPNETVDAVFKYICDSLWEYYATEATMKDGVLELLEDFKAKGIKMCVASGTKADFVVRVLELFKLSPYFAFVVSCSDPDVQIGKDSPKVYEKALRMLGTSIAETVVYEDSCVALETAKKMGFYTVGVIDHNNFGHDRLRAAADIIIEEGASLYRPFLFDPA